MKLQIPKASLSTGSQDRPQTLLDLPVEVRHQHSTWLPRCGDMLMGLAIQVSGPSLHLSISERSSSHNSGLSLVSENRSSKIGAQSPLLPIPRIPTDIPAGRLVESYEVHPTPDNMGIRPNTTPHRHQVPNWLLPKSITYTRQGG